jgi:hypothetical protein
MEIIHFTSFNPEHQETRHEHRQQDQYIEAEIQDLAR